MNDTPSTIWNLNPEHTRTLSAFVVCGSDKLRDILRTTWLQCFRELYVRNINEPNGDVPNTDVVILVGLEGESLDRICFVATRLATTGAVVVVHACEGLKDVATSYIEKWCPSLALEESKSANGAFHTLTFKRKTANAFAYHGTKVALH